MTHVLVKLSNHEDIMGFLEGDDQLRLIIKDPMILISRTDSNDESGIVLINYIPFSSDDYVTFNKANVITTIPLSDDMIRYYTYSKLYCNKTFDKNFNNNLLRSTEYLERYLNQKAKRKPETKNDYVNFFVSQPASNTVN
jgi:hypothetical protein